MVKQIHFAIAIIVVAGSAHGVFGDLERQSRQLQAVSYTSSNALNATVLVTPGSSSGDACNVQFQSQNYNTTAAAPLNIGVAAGQTSSLTFPSSNSSLFFNVTGTAASNPALLDGTIFNATIDPLTGLNVTQFSTANATTGDNATIIAGLYPIVPNSSPLQLDPTALCVINITFTVAAASPPGSSITSSSSSSSSSGTFPNITFPSATGSTTPLPAGIPVTTNNVDGTNRGFGNVGSNNIGNGNTGNCNQGDGNVGNNNKGEGNQGSCNIGNGNVGNGYIGSGNKSGGNGPNFPCNCTITAVASTG